MKDFYLYSFIVSGLVLLSVSEITHAASEKISGQFQQTYTKQDGLPIPQSQGHMVVLTQSEGKNSSTNGSSYMNGANVTISEIADLNRGNGPHSGYVTQTMPNGDETVTSYQGMVTTVLSDSGQPQTSFKGSWEKVSGSGQYKGIKGSGTYTGHFTSEKDYVIDWNGYYFLQ